MMRRKLLIVDDQPEIRKLLRTALGYGKYQLIEAGDGATAMAAVIAEKPEVVVLDVMMPGTIDGFGVCNAIKSDPRFADTFVIMLTARGQIGDFDAGEQAGADAYMVKPFSPARLVEVVEMRERLPAPVRPFAA